MEIKNLEEAIKLQKEFSTKLGRAMGALRKGKAPALEEIVRQHEESISRIQAELESVTKQRDAMVRRWDERAERHKANLAQLEKGLDDFRKKLAAHKAKSGGKDTGNSSARRK
jgi:uncharacterized protein YukE